MHRDLFNIYVFAHFMPLFVFSFSMWILSHKEKAPPTEDFTGVIF